MGILSTVGAQLRFFPGVLLGISDFWITMRFLIFGGGAIGAFYAWRLKIACPAACVDVVCRSNFEAVKKNGYNIFSYMGKANFKPDGVFRSREDVLEKINWSSKPYDYVFMSTKVSFNESHSTSLVEGILHPNHTTLVLLQNGIGIEQAYAERYPDNPILSTVLMAVLRIDDMINLHHPSNSWTLIGPYFLNMEQKTEATKNKDSSGALYTLKKIGELFTEGGISTHILENEIELQAARWSKLAVNLVYGGTQALTAGCNNGDMWGDELRPHTIACVKEIFSSGEFIFKLPFPRPRCPSLETLKKNAERGPNLNVSFTRDWMCGYQTELDAIFTTVLKVAEKYNVDMPRAHAMYSLIKAFKYNNPVKPEVPYNYGVVNDNITIFPE